MYRYLLTITAGMMILALLTACGGVASNPTSPTFNQGNQGGAQEGTTEDGEGLPAELGGQAAEAGEEILQGSYETLWPQGIEAMESGQIVNAAQFFMSAYASDNQSAEAALAYAITDVMRDHRKYSVFMHPGVDRLFMNTPMIGHAEAFPNPFLTEDSYFLRLAALGNNIRQLYPAVGFPIIAPADSETMFNPETLKTLASLETENEMHGDAPFMETRVEDAGGSNVHSPGGDESPADPDEPTDDPGSTAPADAPPGDDGAGRDLTEITKNPLPKADPVKDLDPSGSGGDDPGSGDDIITDFGDGFGGMTGEMGGIAPITGLPEREQAISEDEWIDFIRNYREAAYRDGADIILSANFYENLVKFQEGIRDHVNTLESVRTIAETDGFMLTLPFNVLDGNEKVTLMFDVDDYHLILDYYNMLNFQLIYVLSYKTDMDYFLTSAEVEDLNGDMILTPDEYLPAEPFGTLINGGGERLGLLHSPFNTNLSTHANDMRPILDAARDIQVGDPEPKRLFFQSSFHRNFVLIEDWTQLLQDISEKSSSGHEIKLTAGDEIIDIVAVYDALFINPVENIRDPLPSFSVDTRTVILDEEGNFSTDPTYGGFFPEGLQAVDSYTTVGKFSCIIYDDEMNRASGSVLMMGNQQSEANEKGAVSVMNTSINELVGTPYTVNDEAGVGVGSGAVRTLYELIPLFDVEQIAMVFMPLMAPGGEMGGIGTMPPGDETVMTGEDGIVTGLAPPPPVEGSDGEASDEAGEGTDEDDGEKEEGGDGSGDEDEEVKEEGGGTTTTMG